MFQVFEGSSHINISPPCDRYPDINYPLPEYQVCVLCSHSPPVTAFMQVDVPTAVLSSSVVFVGLILCLCVFVVIIWFQELYEPR